MGNQSTNQTLQVKTVDSIKGTTRFKDLHPDIQSEIQKLDDIFSGHMSNAGRIREILPQQGERVASLAPDVAFIEQNLSTVELGLDNDSANIAHLRELVKKDAEDATLSFRVITNLQLPTQFRYGNPTNLTHSTTKPSPGSSSTEDDDLNKPVDLVSYFSKRTDDLSKTLDLYQRQIREIEAHLRTMEQGTLEKAQQLTGNRSSIRDQRRELVEALRAIEGAILESAKKVGQTRDLVTQQTLGSVGGAVL
jgi:nucleoporin p58/p45